MSRRSNNSRAFYVVQFRELPFEGINDYVCVPYTWVIVQRAKEQVAVVAYPKDEDPFYTRERVKRKERYNDEWRFYMAAVKYETNIYRDAEYWIETRYNHGPIQEAPRITNTQATFTLNNNLPSTSQSNLSRSNSNSRKPLPRISIKRPVRLETNKQLDGKRLKLDEAVQSSSAYVNDAYAKPGCSTKEQLIIIQDNQPMECPQTEESAANSNSDKRTEPKTQCTKQNNKALSLPIIDVDDLYEVIDMDGEDHSQGVKQSNENNSISQSDLSNNILATSMTEAKPSVSGEQIIQPNQHDNQEDILDSGSSSSNCQPRIENVRSIANVTNDHEQRVNKISNNELSTSHKTLSSLKMSAQLCTPRHLVPIKKSSKNICEDMLRKNIERHYSIAAQALTNSTDQTGSLSKHSVEQPLVITQNQSQDGLQARLDGPQRLPTKENKFRYSHQNEYIPINQNNCEQNLNRGSTKSNTDDHRPNSRTIKIPSVGQNSTNPSNSLHQTSELPKQMQSELNQKDLQQQSQRPETRTGVSINPINKRQIPTLQGVTKKTPKPVLSNALNKKRQEITSTHHSSLLNEQELADETRLCEQPTEYNPRDLTTSLQNIAASTISDKCSSNQLPRIQHTTTHENVYQNLSTQKQSVHQSTKKNLKSKGLQVHFIDDVARSRVNKSHVNVIGDPYQTDECMVEKPPSPYPAVTSDSDAFTDNEVTSDHEMFADEAPVEKKNNVFCHDVASGSSSADNPMAARKSASSDHLRHRRVFLEQKMLDTFATLFIQMGSTLRYTYDMYNNLRSSFQETSLTYKKLIQAVELFNSLRNSASNTFPSSNLIPEVLQATEGKHIEVTARANYIDENQHRNSGKNKEYEKTDNNLWRFVLPLEYDPHDTRWTLKYRTDMQGLKELKPQSGIYVNYGELRYFQLVSKDCKSLARRLLPEVFNRTALSVCLSMMEKKTQASNNTDSKVRPELDEHASTVLLSFVIEYGLKCGWNIDPQPILSTLHNKILEIRQKYGLMVQC